MTDIVLKQALKEILGKEVDVPKGISFPIRLESLLQKLQPKEVPALDLGKNGNISLVKKEWEKNGKSIHLTEKEVDILKYLHQRKKQVGKDELLQEIFKYHPEMTTHTIETHIYRLRQKMKKIGTDGLLKTEKEGYCLAG